MRMIIAIADHKLYETVTESIHVEQPKGHGLAELSPKLLVKASKRGRVI